MLSVSLLGDFCITQDEIQVTDIDTPRLQSLLAYLMIHRGAPQSRAHLAFLFWPDTSEAQARTNLRNLLHQLRYALPNADLYLEASVQTLQWRSDAPLILDVAEFEGALTQLLQATQKHDSAIIRQALEHTVSLYKGDLLPCCYDDWIIPQRERLRQDYLEALERLVQLLEEQRDYQAAIYNAQCLLRHEPLHESSYRNLIRLHALNGDRANALRVYHTCTTVLQRELGVEPSAATRETYERLLDEESRPTLKLPITTASTPLIGREKEWRQLLQAWRLVVADRTPHVAILCGEAGIGKTRLVEDLLQWATRQGIANAGTRCYAAEGELAYAPVTVWLRAFPSVPLEDTWLAEVARLLPEMLTERPDLPKPGALTEAWQRERLFEALSRTICSINRPLLLTIDDLQWCDRDTLEWLHFLLRFNQSEQLLVVGTYRPEEVEEKHPLLTLLQALRLDGNLTEIDLQPLDETSTQTLATQVADMGIDKEIAHLLYLETEGNPLFVVELARAGLPVLEQKLTKATSDRPPQGSMLEVVSLPPKVLSVLERRLAQVSPQSRELLDLAATIGREFNFKLLAKASGLEEDTLVRELDELWRRRIVREHGADAYDFTHDKLREVAYSSMSSARHRLLHHHVAQALEALYALEMNPVSYQVASHFENAGLLEQAAPYYLRAAKVARQVYANEEAIALLQRGLTLVEQYAVISKSDENGSELAAQMWEELGDILELKAKHEQALEAFLNGQTQLPSTDLINQARLQRKVGIVMREQRRYPEALEACKRAEIALSEPSDEVSDQWWMEWIEVQVERIWAHYWLAHWPEMEALVNKLSPTVQARASPFSRMQFLMASCLMQLRKDRYVVSDEMLVNSRESLATSLKYGSLKTRIECQFEIGFLHLWRRDLDETEKHLHSSLELTESCGEMPFRTLSLTYLTVLYRFWNQVDEVENYAVRAYESAEVSQMPDYVAAALGNQAWLAWRKRDLSAAEQRSKEALGIWRQSPLVYPFQWQALWPLIAVMLTQGRDDKAWVYAQALLEQTQQLLPNELNSALEAAINLKTKGKDTEARSYLDQAMELARETGYL